MNPFYDISNQQELAPDSLQLNTLGSKRVYMSFGKTTRDSWGKSNTEWNHHMKSVQPEDYDRRFADKLMKAKPIYTMNNVLDHHLNHYCLKHIEGQKDFLIHMRYVVIPILKKLKNSDICITLFEKWLEEKSPLTSKLITPYTVNNNINFGTVNAPVQLQQNSNQSVQTQHNHMQKEQLNDFFNLLRKDIQQVDKAVREDFAMEMDHAIAKLQKERDIKPNLLIIGSLMRDVGIGTFTNLLAAPIFELVKPYLGLA